MTFTEFLDFECEPCAAALPAIEQLRQEYAGRVTFNIRYFPIESHKNARNAAIAVEAAAQQGKLEAMYKKMFETQPSWGEQDDSKAAVFRGFAQGLAWTCRLSTRRWPLADLPDAVSHRGACPFCMAVWSVTIPAFWYVTLHNARVLAGRPGRLGAFVALMIRNHGVVVTAWLLLVAALVTERFWAPWDSIFT